MAGSWVVLAEGFVGLAMTEASLLSRKKIAGVFIIAAFELS